MAKRPATDAAERIEAAKIMEDGHPDPTRLGFWATVDEICKMNLQDHYTIYGYRTDPEHTKEQDPASAFVTTLPLTIADVASQYGGYKWTLNLNRRVDGKNRKVHEVRFEVKDPPILQPHEQLVPAQVRAASLPVTGNSGGPVAEQLVALLGKQFEDLSKSKEEAEAAGRVFNPADALNKTIELMETGFKRTLETAQDSKGGNNELLIAMMNNQSAQMIALINAMGSKKEDPVTQAIVAKFLAESSAPKTSAEETGVNTALSLIREIRSEFGKGVGGGGKGSDWADVAMRVAEKLPEVSERIAGAIVRASAAPGAMPAAIPAARPGPTIVLRPIPQPIAANPAPAAHAAEPPADPAARELEEAQKFLWTLIKGKLVQKLVQGAEIEGDTAGTEAAFVCNEISPSAAKIMAKMFRDIPAHPEILEELKKDAILGPALNHPEMTLAVLQSFATDYVEWFGDDLDDLEAAAQPATEAPVPETVPAS